MHRQELSNVTCGNM